MSFLNTSVLCRGPVKNFFRSAHVIADGRGQCYEFFNTNYKMNLGTFDPELVFANLAETPLSEYKFPHLSLKYSPTDCLEHAVAQGIICHELNVVDIVDKGKGTLFVYTIRGRDEDQNEIFFLQYQFYELGGRNLAKNNNLFSTEKTVKPPQKEPDHIFEYKTHPWSPTYNPTVEDKQKSIFDRNHSKQYHDIFDTKPICHGRYSLGVVMQQILGFFVGGDMRRMKKVKTRFMSMVAPGSTLVTKSWKMENRIHFETFIKETGKCALAASYLDLNEQVSPINVSK